MVRHLLKSFIVDENGKLFFDTPNDWECTDPNTLQFAKKVDDNTWAYAQVLPDILKEVTEGGKVPTIAELDGKLYPEQWSFDEIDITDYSPMEIDEYLDPYGGQEYLEQGDTTQLVCECIFEQLILADDVFSAWYDSQE